MVGLGEGGETFIADVVSVAIEFKAVFAEQFRVDFRGFDVVFAEDF